MEWSFAQSDTTVTEENGRLAIDIANDHNNNGNSNNANRKTETLPIQQWQLNGRQRLRNLAATGFSEWTNAISHKAWTLKHVYNSFFFSLVRRKIRHFWSVWRWKYVTRYDTYGEYFNKVSISFDRC